MDDYYRVKFRKLTGSREPSPRAWIGGPQPPEMPAALRAVHTASSVLAALGWLATVALGRGSPIGYEHPWILLLWLFMPIAVALALGFSEQQSWTRPLMVTLLLASAALAFALRVTWAGAGLGTLALGVAAYLYGSPAARAYYRHLHEDALVQIARADLRGAVFVPLYTGAAGIALGLGLGYTIVTRSLGAVDGMGANDLTGLVAVSVLCATFLGTLGYWIGEALLSMCARRAGADPT